MASSGTSGRLPLPWMALRWGSASDQPGDGLYKVKRDDFFASGWCQLARPKKHSWRAMSRNDRSCPVAPRSSSRPLSFGFFCLYRSLYLRYVCSFDVLDWPWVVLGTSMLELEVGISGFEGCVSFPGLSAPQTLLAPKTENPPRPNLRLF
eukprot:COSAG04_NODE_6431_length_1327_cov_2.285016_2_plen_150_part_00